MKTNHSSEVRKYSNSHSSLFVVEILLPQHQQAPEKDDARCVNYEQYLRFHCNLMMIIPWIVSSSAQLCLFSLV